MELLPSQGPVPLSSLALAAASQNKNTKNQIQGD
jgi:hypothetical protein